jgi:SAM-dependent methyltransferase
MSQDDHGTLRIVTVTRSWWDREAPGYQAEHGAFLDGFVWGPEGLSEADAALLGPMTGKDVLEVGAGAAQCSRWLAERGARPVALDLSLGMLRHGRRARPAPAMVQADAARLPFADGAFDVAFSAYGALPFTPAADRVLGEVHRVLRPGGRWVFSVTHPVRWAFPDDPGPPGLRATLSYFSREPYLERDGTGAVTYAEYHRTVGDWVRLLRGAGLVLEDIVEPEWPADLDEVWGGWSRERGERIPGTAIFVCTRP